MSFGTYFHSAANWLANVEVSQKREVSDTDAIWDGLSLQTAQSASWFFCVLQQQISPTIQHWAVGQVPRLSVVVSASVKLRTRCFFCSRCHSEVAGGLLKPPVIQNIPLPLTGTLDRSNKQSGILNSFPQPSSDRSRLKIDSTVHRRNPFKCKHINERGMKCDHQLCDYHMTG